MSSARWWAEQQRAQTIKRELAAQAHDLAAACQNGHELPELMDTLAGMYREALAADPAARRRVRDTAGVMAEISESARRPEGARILTGLPTLDWVTKGIAEGEVLTIIARPQVGKSALATQIASTPPAGRNGACSSASKCPASKPSPASCSRPQALMTRR